MIDLFTVIMGITVLFAIFLILRSLANLKICALCAAVSGSWLILLALMLSGKEIDPALVGILMGGSAVGLMYTLEKKLPDKYSILKLPFLLTLFSLIYLALEKPVSKEAGLALLVLWIVFGVLFALRNVENIRKTAQKIIECCKNW